MPQPPGASRAQATAEVADAQEVLVAPGVQALVGQAQEVVPAAQVWEVEGQAASATTLRQVQLSIIPFTSRQVPIMFDPAGSHAGEPGLTQPGSEMHALPPPAPPP